MDKDTKKEIFEALSSITGLGLGVMISFLLWVGIAMWLQNKYSLGDYVMVIGVLMGIGSGCATFMKFCLRDVKRGKKDEK